ncbi:MAG: hypothetical protein LBM66_02800, partial [Bifidobacteriaceae bacterium]|nr:hypothetical protein [Bifidobacteriaceae bacterium]
MSLTGLIDLLAGDAGFAEARDRAWAAGGPAHTDERVAVLAPEGALVPLAAAIAERRPTVIVTATGRAAETAADGLAAYLGPELVATLPSWETLPHERMSPRSDTLAHRIAVFRRLAHPESDGPHGPIRALTVPVRSLIQPVVAGLGEIAPIRLAPGDRVDLEELAQRLVEFAYTRTDMVERRGEFAVRGGIVDVFPPTEHHPLRVDLFGDEVDEIRYFSVADQRSDEEAASGLWAPPCRELLLTDRVRERAAQLAETMPGERELMDKLAQGIAVEGMEAFTPVLADRLCPLTDLLPAGAVLLLADPEKLRRRAQDLRSTAQEFLEAAWSGAAHGGAAPVDLGAGSYMPLPQVRAAALARGHVWWTAGAFGVTPASGEDGTPEGGPDPAPAEASTTDPGTDPAGPAHGEAPASAAQTDPDEPGPDVSVIELGMRAGELFGGDVRAAIGHIRDRAQSGWRVIVLTEGNGPAKRLAEQLGERDIPARLDSDVREAAQVTPGVVHVTVGPGHGLVAEALKLQILTQAELTGRSGASTKDMRRMPRKRKNAVDPL